MIIIIFFLNENKYISFFSTLIMRLCNVLLTVITHTFLTVIQIFGTMNTFFYSRSLFLSKNTALTKNIHINVSLLTNVIQYSVLYLV